LGIPYPVI